eukprot:5519777-Prymnesium_polylepis.2
MLSILLPIDILERCRQRKTTAISCAAVARERDPRVVGDARAAHGRGRRCGQWLMQQRLVGALPQRCRRLDARAAQSLTRRLLSRLENAHALLERGDLQLPPAALGRKLLAGRLDRRLHGRKIATRRRCLVRQLLTRRQHLSPHRLQLLIGCGPLSRNLLTRRLRLRLHRLQLSA